MNSDHLCFCKAGAACGDHCSLISDTTIMASSRCGDQRTYRHVLFQLPYAMVCGNVSVILSQVCLNGMDRTSGKESFL